MSNQDDNDLTDRQQLLLSRYVDGECGLMRSLQVKRLLATQSAARQYLNDLKRTRTVLSERLSAPQSVSVDLWDRIEARIEQEERAALFLGARSVETRNIPTQPDSIWSAFSSPATWVGGLSGAAVAAAFLVFLYKPAQIVSFSAPQQVALQNSPQQVRPIAMGSTRSSHTPITRLRPPSSFEVDWMRSHGSLNVIPDSSGTSAIIWVRRRQMPVARSLNPLTPRQPKALLTASPTAPSSRLIEHLDGKHLPGAK
jgi:hypothetical protein